MDQIDHCIVACKELHAKYTIERLHQELVIATGLTVEEIQEKYRSHRLNYLISELCHLKCVPGYGDQLQQEEKDGKASPKLKLDPPSGA